MPDPATAPPKAIAKEPTLAESKEPAITHAEVLAQANQLTESNKLTTAWTKTKLESKAVKDFKEEELTKLKAELDEFTKAHAAANEVE